MWVAAAAESESAKHANRRRNCGRWIVSTIFVQVASYRDPQLLPTLRDCVQKARYPERLTFGICWQRDETETLGEFAGDPRVQVMAVDWRDSRGTCWARHHVQRMYRGETYTLQLDSHHRFVEGWDALLIDMFEATGRPKPILTAYAPSFDPEDDSAFVQVPWSLGFDRFIPEGAVFFMPHEMRDWQERTTPEPGRFLSAHFFFTLGQFCTEVPYDPNYYFHGEEISLSVRAFTHGYDLFYPHRVVLWHEYTRKYRTKHWDDHVPGKVATKPWTQLNDETHQRNRVLFGMEPGDVDFGPYGFGTARSVADYEAFAGLSFRLRLAHTYTVENYPPPNPEVYQTDDEWREKCIRDFWTRIRVPRACVDGTDDCDFWFCGVHDHAGQEIFRQDLHSEHLAALRGDDAGEEVAFAFKYRGLQPAVSWTIWPHHPARGWLQKISGRLGEPGEIVPTDAAV